MASLHVNKQRMGENNNNNKNIIKAQIEQESTWVLRSSFAPSDITNDMAVMLWWLVHPGLTMAFLMCEGLSTSSLSGHIDHWRNSPKQCSVLDRKDPTLISEYFLFLKLEKKYSPAVTVMGPLLWFTEVRGCADFPYWHRSLPHTLSSQVRSPSTKVNAKA